MISDIDGVYASGIQCGIKPGKEDLAYIFIPNCAGSAVVLSQNLIRSASLDHNEGVFKKGPVKLMIINSGNANSVTGDIGHVHVRQTIDKAAQVFGCEVDHIGVASTGIIGVPLPIQSVLDGIDQFDIHAKDGHACASAILTTDLVKKESFRSVRIQDHDVHIAGITKGSGMIAPNMATTLGFITTNLSLDCAHCQSLLTSAIQDSYNMLSVDTDQSTNDMVSFHSSGALELSLTAEDMAVFQAELTALCIDLAKQIARDGEGAQHLLEVCVTGAMSKNDAQTIAKLVVESPLVKTAVAGNDPNWGRIMMALGKDPHVSIDQ